MGNIKPDTFKKYLFCDHSVKISEEFKVLFDNSEYIIRCPDCGKEFSESAISEACEFFADYQQGTHITEIECDCPKKIVVNFDYNLVPDIDIDAIYIKKEGGEIR